LYSNLGVLVYEDSEFRAPSGTETDLPFFGLPNGVYHLDLQSKAYRIREKLVVVK
jgi:hypothetical protein